MTGAYLRVQREGKWQPIEVEHLTDAERAGIFADKPNEEIMKWLNLVCDRLADLQPLLEGLEKDGIIKRSGATLPGHYHRPPGGEGQ